VSLGTSKLRYVPLINRVPAGDWENLVDAIEPGAAERVIETTANVGPNGFALTVTGHSMVAVAGPHSFPPGTVLFVNPDMEPQVGHFVVVRHNGDTEFTFKRLARDAGRWVLEPLNQKYDVLVMPSDAHICGVVVKAEINTI
jgi:SOS-response transcriptional repressor LexA